uniref:Uncharacterized protein n=1 Tax=Clandestinovirus TaxID=2831644 RepID=A0A8F8KPP3_9VIRU|nr:hypothetical protein KOM_12_513 [Clandestinovirus]
MDTTPYCLTKLLPKEIVHLVGIKVNRIDSDLDAFASSLIEHYCIVKSQYLQYDIMKAELIERIRYVLDTVEGEILDAGEETYSYFTEHANDLQDILFCAKDWVDVDWRKGDADLNIHSDLEEFVTKMSGIKFDSEW